MLTWVIIAVFSLPALLTAVWFLEVLAGCLALHLDRPTFAEFTRARPFTMAVLIPAHNEGKGTIPTVRDVKAQLGPGDRVVVVADNCIDDTAAFARAAGAEVIVRNDPQRRGKGFALEFGVRHLSNDPPDVVVFMDADCRLADDALLHLSQSALASKRPVQAIYLMLAPEDARPEIGVRLFAWRVKNWLRPLGMKTLGLPAQLFGTGMAFPFGLLKGHDLGNSRLAEDTALGLALASAGHPPLFVSEARIHSYFPGSQAGSEQQRQRWEKGHFDNVADFALCAIATSLRAGNLPLAALAIDMTVPPLALLVLITTLCEFLGGAAVLMGASTVVLAIPTFSVLLLVTGVALAWAAVGRDALPFRILYCLPLYILEKLGFYYRTVCGKATSAWVRTDRD